MNRNGGDLFDETLRWGEANREEFVESRACDEETRAAILEVWRQGDERQGNSQPLLGSRYGPYRLLRKIGRGGTSAVYLAVRADGAFLRRVALKVVPPHPGGSQVAVDRSLEPQIMAGLEHEGVARLYDAGTSDDGEIYLAMEYVDGVPIDAYCEREALALFPRLAVFLRACDAVAFAHQNLVVHRDLKPSNILVADNGRPKLLDFGIARLFDPEMEDPTVTIGPRALTPAYASPEQLAGQRVTTLSDVFSLGALLYRLLTGADPFPRSVDDRLAMLEAGQDPALPSHALGTRSTPDGWPVRQREIEGDVDAIVMKALKARPSERYLSIGELASDLRRFESGIPVRARRASSLGRALKFVRRHRAAVSSGVVMLAGLTTAVISLAVMNDRISDERAAAERARATAERTTEFLLTTFAAADPKAGQDGELTVREVLDEP